MTTAGLSVTLALGLLVAPLAAAAQPPAKIPRVGFLGSDDRPRTPFRQGLRELGSLPLRADHVIE